MSPGATTAWWRAGQVLGRRGALWRTLLFAWHQHVQAVAVTGCRFKLASSQGEICVSGDASLVPVRLPAAQQVCHTSLLSSCMIA